jgi:hypothetical protein
MQITIDRSHPTVVFLTKLADYGVDTFKNSERELIEDLNNFMSYPPFLFSIPFNLRLWASIAPNFILTNINILIPNQSTAR